MSSPCRKRSFPRRPSTAFTVAATVLIVLSCLVAPSQGFSVVLPTKTSLAQHRLSSSALASTFAADGSEYSSRDSGDDEDEDDTGGSGADGYVRDELDDGTEGETIELSPVAMSKNSGNRFVSLIFDRLLVKGRDALELHEDRIALTEDHVMYCRKANLYNETFNTGSMVDILWSLPILSSDLRRVIGHAMCMESSALEHVHNFMKKEPIIQTMTGGDLSNVPLFRWRHIRDYSLRIDDGRFGFPCLCLGMDHDPAAEIGSGSSTGSSNLRTDVYKSQLEYLIRSEKVIAAGPLHLPTEFKDDPSSLAVGDLMLFNAKNRADAIEFVEQMPYAADGLYEDLRVHFYNTLDVTGKFVSEDPLADAPTADLKDAMEYWGYPVHDNQTPWLNW